MLKVAVLVSGGGTNLQAIIDAIDNKVITDTEIVAVISNNKNAFALERAKKVGIAAEVVSPKDYADRARFNEALLAKLQETGADLIVLAGYPPAEDTYSQPHADKDRDGDAAFAAAEQLSDSG